MLGGVFGLIKAGLPGVWRETPKVAPGTTEAKQALCVGLGQESAQICRSAEQDKARPMTPAQGSRRLVEPRRRRPGGSEAPGKPHPIDDNGQCRLRKIPYFRFKT